MLIHQTMWVSCTAAFLVLVIVKHQIWSGVFSLKGGICQCAVLNASALSCNTTWSWKEKFSGCSPEMFPHLCLFVQSWTIKPISYLDMKILMLKSEVFFAAVLISIHLKYSCQVLTLTCYKVLSKTENIKPKTKLLAKALKISSETESQFNITREGKKERKSGRYIEFLTGRTSPEVLVY